jgi:hypothetical protein
VQQSFQRAALGLHLLTGAAQDVMGVLDSVCEVTQYPLSVRRYHELPRGYQQSVARKWVQSSESSRVCSRTQECLDFIKICNTLQRVLPWIW